MFVFVSDIKFSIALITGRHSCYRINMRIYIFRGQFLPNGYWSGAGWKVFLFDFKLKRWPLSSQHIMCSMQTNSTSIHFVFFYMFISCDRWTSGCNVYSMYFQYSISSLNLPINASESILCTAIDTIRQIEKFSLVTQETL